MSRKTVEKKIRAVVHGYSVPGRIKMATRADTALEDMIKDLVRAAEAHARSEVRRVTKDWDHGL